MFWFGLIRRKSCSLVYSHLSINCIYWIRGTRREQIVWLDPDCVTQLTGLFRGWLTANGYVEKWADISQPPQWPGCAGKEEAPDIPASVEWIPPSSQRCPSVCFSSHLPHPRLKSLYFLFSLTPTALSPLFPLFVGLSLPEPFCPNPQHVISAPFYSSKIPRDSPPSLTFWWRVLTINWEY